MVRAVVDTSCLVAIAFGERAGARMVRRLGECDELFASALIEAELWASLRREKVDADPQAFLGGLALVSPDRPLRPELTRVAEAGYLRGADMWHLACALYLSPNAAGLTFLTLDEAQGRAARALGFKR